MAIVYKNPENAYVLLCRLDGICKKNKIQYTLIEDTLLGAAKERGFLNHSYTIHVAMIVSNYRKFLDACELENINSVFYNANIFTRGDIEEVYTYFARKSRVQLPDGRGQDEFYYDYFIKVYPVFFAGNTRKEAGKFLTQYRELMKTIHARKVMNEKKNLKKRIKAQRAKKYLKKDRIAALAHLKNLIKKNSTPSKYLMFPSKNQSGRYSISYIDNWTELEELKFEGNSFPVISQYEKWLKKFYGRGCIKKNIDFPINAMLLRGPEELRRVQLVQLDILKQVDAICRKHKIQYFLCSGTLLGAVRHKGFIPWDYDADVALTKKEYDRFLEACEEELDKENYFVRNKETEPTIHITYTQIRRNGTSFIRMGRENNKKAHHGILVDVFPVYKGGNTWLAHKLQTKLCMFYKTMFWTHNGAKSEKKLLKKIYYLCLAKIDPQISYDKYIKYATKYENEKTQKVAWLVAGNNPYYSDFTDRELYSTYEDIEFEGCTFRTIKEKEKYLTTVYTEKYMDYLPEASRNNGFLPSAFDAGELFQYEKKGEIM